MRMSPFITTLLLVAGCATPLPQTPPAGIPAQLAPPEVRAGDYWTYSAHDGYTKLPLGTLEYRVSSVQGETVTVLRQHDGRQSIELYTRDWNWRERPMTNLQNFRYEPAYAALPFPLESGKAWQAYVKATDPETGRANRVRIDGKMLGWERVKVPAGEFDAIKVRRMVYAGNADVFTTEEHIIETDWYAPKLGQIVRHESSSRHLDRRVSCDNAPDCGVIRGDWNVVELVNYRR